MPAQQTKDDYGRSPENPIRVSGFFEAREYFSHLFPAGGDKPVRFRRVGSCASPIPHHCLDCYRISPQSIFHRADWLYLDIYGDCDWRAPSGYSLNCERPQPDENDTFIQRSDGLLARIIAFSDLKKEDSL